MIYRNHTIVSDSTHYKYGQHAARVERGNCKFWFDNFCAAVEFVREVAA